MRPVHRPDSPETSETLGRLSRLVRAGRNRILSTDRIRRSVRRVEGRPAPRPVLRRAASPGDGGGEGRRVGDWESGVGSGTGAAHTRRGSTGPWAPVPWFWSDQGTDKLQIAGLNTGYDRIVTRGPEGEAVHRGRSPRPRSDT